MNYLRHVRSSQPPAGTGLDLSNPITNRLYAAINVAHVEYIFEGAVSKRASSGFGMPVATASGLALTRSDGTGSWGVPLLLGSRSPPANDSYTLMAVWMLPSRPTQAQVVIANTAQAGNATNLAIEVVTADGGVTSSIRARIYLGTARYFGEVPLTDDMLGRPLVLIARHFNGGEQSFWINGAKVGATLNQTGSTVGVQYIGHQGNGSAGYGYLMAAWHRGLSGDAIESLAKNPWQIFESTKSKIFVGHQNAVVSDGTKVLARREVVRNAQPQSPATFNPAFPAPNAAFLGATGRRDLVTGNPYVYTNGDDAPVPTDKGLALGWHRSSANARIGAASGLDAVMVMFRLPVVDVTSNLFGGLDAGGLGPVMRLNAGVLQFQATESSSAFISSPLALEAGKIYCAFGFTTGISTSQRFLFVDGIDVGTGATGNSRADKGLTIARIGPAGGFAPAGAILAAAVWKGAFFTKEQARALSANPWQLFTGLKVPLFNAVPAAVGAGRLKRWNGSAWEVVAAPKAYNGSAFVAGVLKSWNGSAWVT